MTLGRTRRPWSGVGSVPLAVAGIMTGCTTLQDRWVMSPNDPTLQETQGVETGEQAGQPTPPREPETNGPTPTAPPPSPANDPAVLAADPTAPGPTEGGRPEEATVSPASASTPSAEQPTPEAPAPVEPIQVEPAAPTAAVTSQASLPETSPSPTPAAESQPSPSQPSPSQPSPSQPSAEESQQARAEQPIVAEPSAVAKSPAVEEQPAKEAPPARPRVTLNPTGVEDARPVPTLQGEEPSEPPRDVPNLRDQVPAEAARAPGQPLAVSGVEIPRAAELDPQMEAELTAAMAENPLSAMINEKAAAAGPPQPIDLENLQPGRRLRGTIQLVSEETVFVELGLRSPGMLQRRQFPAETTPEPGQEIEVVVDSVDVGEGAVLVSLPKARRKPGGNWDAVQKGQVVDAMVNKTNKGGLEVTVSGLRGFLPASQVDLGFVENLESYVGQKLTCVVTEVNPQKKNLVLSRRAYLQQERQEKEKELWQTLSVGQSLEGTVKTIKDYGAFVDLGGVDGFLHVGEISWNRIGHPSDVLKVGDTIQVRILKLDPESKKIGLGMKQLQSNPWQSVDQKYPVGSTVSGRVTRTTDFGAFVELEQGVEGLIHISELEHRRVGRVTEVVKEGDQVEAKVLTVEPNRKRISLSLKALKNRPEPEPAASAPTAPPYERKRKEPLRGGKESERSSRGGLFGNPDDFRR